MLNKKPNTHTEKKKITNLKIIKKSNHQLELTIIINDN